MLSLVMFLAMSLRDCCSAARVLCRNSEEEEDLDGEPVLVVVVVIVENANTKLFGKVECSSS